jgi:hypothetical protein
MAWRIDLDAKTIGRMLDAAARDDKKLKRTGEGT